MRAKLLHLWQVMQACVERGFRQTGLLPGVLKVRRRAPRLYRMLTESAHREAARCHGLGECLRARRERGERRRRARGDRADQRRGRHRAGGAAFLPALRGRRERRGRHPLPAGRRRHGHALQAQRLHLRRRDGLPGRGRRRLLDGRGGPGRGAAGHQRADRERRRDRHGAQPRAHLRSGGGAGADSLHRAQRHGVRSRPSTPRGSPCAAMARTRCRSTR